MAWKLPPPAPTPPPLPAPPPSSMVPGLMPPVSSPLSRLPKFTSASDCDPPLVGSPLLSSVASGPLPGPMVTRALLPPAPADAVDVPEVPPIVMPAAYAEMLATPISRAAVRAAVFRIGLFIGNLLVEHRRIGGEGRDRILPRPRDRWESSEMKHSVHIAHRFSYV